MIHTVSQTDFWCRDRICISLWDDKHYSSESDEEAVVEEVWVMFFSQSFWRTPKVALERGSFSITLAVGDVDWVTLLYMSIEVPLENFLILLAFSSSLLNDGNLVKLSNWYKMVCSLILNLEPKQFVCAALQGVKSALNIYQNGSFWRKSRLCLEFFRQVQRNIKLGLWQKDSLYSHMIGFIVPFQKPFWLLPHSMEVSPTACFSMGMSSWFMPI